MKKVIVVYTTDGNGDPFILGVFADSERAARMIEKMQGCCVEDVWQSEEVVE